MAATVTKEPIYDVESPWFVIYVTPYAAVLYACDDCITKIETIDAFTEFIDT